VHAAGGGATTAARAAQRPLLGVCAQHARLHQCLTCADVWQGANHVCIVLLGQWRRSASGHSLLASVVLEERQREAALSVTAAKLASAIGGQKMAALRVLRLVRAAISRGMVSQLLMAWRVSVAELWHGDAGGESLALDMRRRAALVWMAHIVARWAKEGTGLLLATWKINAQVRPPTVQRGPPMQNLEGPRCD